MLFRQAEKQKRTETWKLCRLSQADLLLSGFLHRYYPLLLSWGHGPSPCLPLSPSFSLLFPITQLEREGGIALASSHIGLSTLLITFVLLMQESFPEEAAWGEEGHVPGLPLGSLWKDSQMGLNMMYFSVLGVPAHSSSTDSGSRVIMSDNIANTSSSLLFFSWLQGNQKKKRRYRLVQSRRALCRPHLKVNTNSQNHRTVIWRPQRTYRDHGVHFTLQVRKLPNALCDICKGDSYF